MEKFLGFIIAFVLISALCCFEAFVVMLLWNWVIVAIFALPKISFWLSLGLCATVSLIIGKINRK